MLSFKMFGISTFLTSNDVAETLDETAEQLGDKVDKFTEQTKHFNDWIKDQIPNVIMYIFMIIIALVVFFIGRKLIKLILKIIDRSFKRSNIDEGVCKFLHSLFKISLNIILIVIIAGFLGLETTSLAAIVGSAGLAIGLSLQGSLANFAGGVLILLLKPFLIGDYIVTGTEEGFVTHIDIFYTRLITVDNRKVVIPNGTLSNATITNVSSEPVRRIDLSIGIEYSEDVDKVKKLLLDIAESEEQVIKDKPIDIYVDSFAASSVTIGFRVWTASENYWSLKWKMQENIKKEFDKNGVSIPFDQLDVNIHQ